MSEEQTPLPSESDQAPAQSDAKPLLPAVSAGGDAALIREEHLPEALRVLIEAGPRGLAAGLQVATRWSDQQAEEMRILREELRETRNSESKLREHLHRAEKRVARLEERINALTAQIGIRALGITIGTLVFGMGLVADSDSVKAILAVLGLALVIVLSLAPLARRGLDE